MGRRGGTGGGGGGAVCRVCVACGRSPLKGIPYVEFPELVTKYALKKYYIDFFYLFFFFQILANIFLLPYW